MPAVRAHAGLHVIMPACADHAGGACSCRPPRDHAGLRV